jgi:hypothetical protein
MRKNSKLWTLLISSVGETPFLAKVFNQVGSTRLLVNLMSLSLRFCPEKFPRTAFKENLRILSIQIHFLRQQRSGYYLTPFTIQNTGWTKSIRCHGIHLVLHHQKSL